MILEKILARKRENIAKKKSSIEHDFYNAAHFVKRDPVSLVKNFRTSGTGIITEFKRKSPSKGWYPRHDFETVVLGYQQYGALGISILTDEDFFGGSVQDILSIRDKVSIPVLRKEFIIDESQVLESKMIGADVILLIAACITPEKFSLLAKLARSLGLEVLFEVHNAREINSYDLSLADIIGVNNRNLNELSVDIERSVSLYDNLPKDKILLSESGLKNCSDLQCLSETGFHGFLMGDVFLNSTDPVQKFRLLNNYK